MAIVRGAVTPLLRSTVRGVGLAHQRRFFETVGTETGTVMRFDINDRNPDRNPDIGDGWFNPFDPGSDIPSWRSPFDPYKPEPESDDGKPKEDGDGAKGGKKCGSCSAADYQAGDAHCSTHHGQSGVCFCSKILNEEGKCVLSFSCPPCGDAPSKPKETGSDIGWGSNS